MRKFAIHPRWSVMLALLVGLAFTPHSTLHAQSFYGSIVGTVTDTSGAIIPGATVTVTNKSTDEKHVATANGAGEFSFVDLVPSTYSVVIERSNFKRYLRDTVTVEVNSTVRVNASLQVGAVTETVEISTAGVNLQTDSSTLSNKVEGQQVQEMPLNGRNVMNLLELVPGVIPTNSQELQTGMNQGGTGTNPGGWNGFTTNGSSDSNMEYMDGAALNVLEGNNITLVPTQDAVQEFSVDTSVTSAETGRGTSGMVNMTSKTGTNAWHGSAYEYFRNADMNANTYFGNAAGAQRGEWNQNQYGVNIGAPIKKDKIFFFGSWEVFDIKTGVALTTNVPTNGNAFSNGGNIDAGIFTRQIADPNAPGDGCVITQNGTGSAATWTMGQTCMDSTAQYLKQVWPAPNANIGNGADNYFVNEPDGDHQNQENVRVDFNLSPKQRLFVHQAWWHIQDVPAVPFPGNPPAFHVAGEAATFNNNLEILGDTITLSPKTVVDLRADYLRFFFGAFSTPVNFQLAPLGSAWAALEPLVPAGNQWFPNISISGIHNIDGIGNNHGMTQHWDTYGVNGSITHIMGRHSIKVGGEARFMDLEVGVTQFANGDPTFGINFSGNSNTVSPVNGLAEGDEFADYLMGDFSSIAFGGGEEAANMNYYQGYYVQDTWQANRKLTVNLGLRYELPGGLYERNNNAVVLEPYSTDSTTLANGTEALVSSPQYAGRSVFAVHHDLFDPRVGFAYRLDNKTVVRGAYGITNMSVDQNSGGSGPAGAAINGVSASWTNPSNRGAQAAANRLVSAIPTSFIVPALHRSNYTGPLGTNLPFMEALMLGSDGFSPITNAPTGSAGGYGASAYYPYVKVPYVQQYNFTVQRTIGNNFQTTVSYVGTHSVNLKAGGSLDQALYSSYSVTTTGVYGGGDGSAALQQTATPISGPNAGKNLQSTLSTPICTPNNTVCNYNDKVGRTLQPYPNYSGFSVSNLTYGNSHYNALQVTSQYRIRGGGSIGGAFTFAKTIGDTAGNQNIYNHHEARSVSGTPSRLAVNYVLPLPFGQGQAYAHFSGVADKIVSGWQLNGITSFTHGGYLGISSPGNQIPGGGGTRPNYVPGGSVVVNGTTYNCNSNKKTSGSAVARLNEWFNVGCFQYPGDYSLGNENPSDNNLFAQGQDNWDIGLLKSTKATERATVQFRAKAFNIFNRFQAGTPNTTVNNTTIGKVTSQANNPRLIQLSLRVSF